MESAKIITLWDDQICILGGLNNNIVIKFVTSILQQLNIFTRRPPTKSQGKRCVTKSRVRKQEKIIQTSVEGQRLLFIMDTCRVICHSSSRDLSFNSILYTTAQNKYFWQLKILKQIVTWSSKKVYRFTENFIFCRGKTIHNLASC